MSPPSTTGGITGVYREKVVPASAKDPDGWNAADKFTLVLETAGLNATELSAYCRERGLFLSRWTAGARPLRMPMHSPC